MQFTFLPCPPLPPRPRFHSLKTRVPICAVRPNTSEALITHLWQLQSSNEFLKAGTLFAPHAVYHDTLYPRPFEGLNAIENHLRNMEVVMPSAITFVLDEMAAGERKVGARWHAESKGGLVPFSRGASMYTVDDDGEGGLWIVEAWDFVETPFKVAALVLPLFRVASRAMNIFGSVKGNK